MFARKGTPLNLKQLDHLMQTTITKDAIKVIYINKNENHSSLNPFARYSPAFLSSNLSIYFGANGVINAKRIGKEFRTKAKTQLESAFSVILFCDREENISIILNQINGILVDETKKYPFVILTTTDDRVYHDPIIAKMVTTRVVLSALPVNENEQNTMMLDQLTPALGALYNDTSIRTNITYRRGS